MNSLLARAGAPTRPPPLLPLGRGGRGAAAALPTTEARRRARRPSAAARARRNDTAKGPRHETRPSAANARARSGRRRQQQGPPGGLEGGGDPLVPEELLREAQGTEAYRYARALSAAMTARRRPLALRSALALAVARSARLLPAGGGGGALRGGGGGGGGVRPAALAARLAQLSETLNISAADAAELLAGASGGPDEEEEEEEEDGDEAEVDEEEGNGAGGSHSSRRGRRRQQQRPAAGPPPAALEDVLPLRLLRAAEGLVAALELDLDEPDAADQEEEEDAEEEEAERAGDCFARLLGLSPAGIDEAAAAAASSASRPPSLPPEPPADARAASLRLAVRAIALRPALLDASPLNVRRRAAAAAAALGLPLPLAGRRLFAREPALMLDVSPDALSKRLSSLARVLASSPPPPAAAAEAAALAIVLREPRVLLPAARALAANVAALPAVLGVPRGCGYGGGDGALAPVAACLIHAPLLALVPADEVARRLESLRRLLPPLPPPAVGGAEDEAAASLPPCDLPPTPWPLLRTPCGLVYDPRLLTLPPERLAERARHLQRLERLAAQAEASDGSIGGPPRPGGPPRQQEQRQRRARLLSESPAALDGWCADAMHLLPGLRRRGEAAAAARLLSS